MLLLPRNPTVWPLGVQYTSKSRNEFGGDEGLALAAQVVLGVGRCLEQLLMSPRVCLVDFASKATTHLALASRLAKLAMNTAMSCGERLLLGRRQDPSRQVRKPEWCGASNL